MAAPPEDIIVAILQGRPGIVAELVETDGTFRIFTGAAPQRARLPYVIVQPITANPIEDADGGNDIEFTDVQVDVYAASNIEARTLARSIRDALNDKRDSTILGTRVWQIRRTIGLAFTEAAKTGNDRPTYRRMAEYAVLHDQ